MKSYLSLYAVLFAATVGAHEIRINDQVDKALEKNNELVRRIGRSTLPFHLAHVAGKVTFTKGMIIGLDSKVRTGYCTVSMGGTSKYVDIHVGFSLLGVVLQDLKINGDEMSAFVRIRDNSIHFSYNIDNATDCHVFLDQFKFERLENAEMVASRPKYDGLDASEYVREALLSKINQYLLSLGHIVENHLQEICGQTHSLVRIAEESIAYGFLSGFNNRTISVS